MPQLAIQQLDSIHSMLSAGHRNLRVEQHSLVLWGTICGGLILASNRILTAEQFPVVEQRAIAWLILLALTVSGVSLLDWHLTRRAKQARDEAWSFIHRQVLKVWWLLLPLVLNEPIEIVMNSGQPTGDWRFPGGSWTKARETQGISIPWVKAELTPLAGPEIRTSLVVKTRHQPTN